MNERIKQLANKAGYNDQIYEISKEGLEKFAELFVQECGVALAPMLRDMISRGQAYDLIKQHFGIEEHKGWVCPKCGADRTKIACPLGFGASVDGRCPMIATAQTGVEK